MNRYQIALGKKPEETPSDSEIFCGSDQHCNHKRGLKCFQPVSPNYSCVHKQGVERMLNSVLVDEMATFREIVYFCGHSLPCISHIKQLNGAVICKAERPCGSKFKSRTEA